MAGDKHIPNSAWEDSFVKLAKKYAMLGLTLEQFAGVIDVHYQSIMYWMRTKPEFKASWNEGKELSDANVAESLYSQCFDRYVDEEQIVSFHGVDRVVKVKKFIPASEKACRTWLSNRQRANWGQQLPGQLALTQNNLTINNIDLTKLSTKELETLEKFGLLALMPKKDDAA